MAKSKAARKKDIGESGVSISELDRLAGAPPLVAIDHLYAGYGRMQVVSDISLRVARGRSLCLVGPNGAGKSTVLNAITALPGFSQAPSRFQAATPPSYRRARSSNPRGLLTFYRKTPCSPT
jgi:ABC-type molybdenum transport system ATPase subunit/photorepair protein PhrA